MCARLTKTGGGICCTECCTEVYESSQQCRVSGLLLTSPSSPSLPTTPLSPPRHRTDPLSHLLHPSAPLSNSPHVFQSSPALWRPPTSVPHLAPEALARTAEERAVGLLCWCTRTSPFLICPPPDLGARVDAVFVPPTSSRLPSLLTSSTLYLRRLLTTPFPLASSPSAGGLSSMPRSPPPMPRPSPTPTALTTPSPSPSPSPTGFPDSAPP